MAQRGLHVITDRMRKLRLLKDLTQKDVSDKTGWSLSVINEMERGKEVGPAPIRDVAHLLGTTIEYLVGAEASLVTSAETEDKQNQIMQSMHNTGFMSQLKEILGKDTTAYIVVVSGSTLGLLLAMAGTLPVYAVPYYWGGVALSSCTLCYAKVHGKAITFPLISLLLSVTALIVWPRALGVFKSEDGYALAYDLRREYIKYDDERYNGYLEININSPKGYRAGVNELTGMRVIPENQPEWHQRRFNGTLAFTYFGYQWSDQSVTVAIDVNLKEVARKTVIMKPLIEGHTICDIDIKEIPKVDYACVEILIRGNPLVTSEKNKEEAILYIDGVLHRGRIYARESNYIKAEPGEHEFVVHYQGIVYKKTRHVLAPDEPNQSSLLFPNIIAFNGKHPQYNE